MKESQTRGEQEIEKQINECLNPKDFGKSVDLEFNEQDLKDLNEGKSLVHDFWENLREGLLKYMTTYLVVAILALFALLIFYIFLSLLSPIFFIAIDMLLLATTLTGIFPVIRGALP
jgi:uncharacterized membrane protein